MRINQRPENREIYLCAAAKDEDPYIDEWMDYHFKLGFEKIVIFRNDWFYENHDPRVEVFMANGNNIQNHVYGEFLTKWRKKFWWVAFIDLDEFIVLHKHKNMEEFLLEYDDVQALAINWALFGSNGHKKVVNNNYNVLTRFTRRGTEEDHTLMKARGTIKTLVRYTNRTRGMGVHNCFGITHTLKREEIFEKPNTPTIDWEIAQVNHYWIKSLEEAEKKMNRGRATTTIKRDWKEFFIDRDQYSNSVEDLSAIRFYYGDTMYNKILKEREERKE